MTVGGLPGTGTSTLCKLLEARLGLPHVDAGQLYRQEAARRGLSLAAMNELSQRDPTIDRDLDDLQLELLARGGLILEGRMSGWLARTHAIPAFTVWVVCDLDEVIRRLVKRDGGDPDAQRRLTLDRQAREQDRYRRYYGADPTDASVYDLVLDSTRTPADGLADQVVRRLSPVPGPILDG